MDRHPHSHRHPAAPRRKQKGVVLLVLFAVLGIAAAALLVTALNRQSARLENDTQTVDALAQARDALIGYAANFRTTDSDAVLGYLLPPDMGPAISTGGEGTSAPNFAGNDAGLNLIGRLPWKSLGLPPLRDGSGECLWYAVSGRFKDTPVPRTSPLNWDTPGQFDLKSEDGVTTLASNVVAVVFGPGPVIPGQTRTPLPAGAATCGGNYDDAAYLDTPNAANAISGILNYYPGTTNSGVAPDSTNKSLLTQASGTFYNDRMLAITTDDLFRTIKQRSDFKSDIDNLLTNLQSCLNTHPPIPNASANNKGADALDDCGSKLPSIQLQNFYTNWKNNLLYAKLPTPTKITLNGVQTTQACSAVVIFGGQRVDDAHARWTDAAKKVASNYLEGVNAASFPNGTAYSGWSGFDKNNPSRDLIACITPSAGGTSQKLDFSNITNDFNKVTQNFRQGQMVTDLGNQSLQLGGTLWSAKKNAVPTVCPVNSNQCLRNLYGCAWSRQSYDFGSGFRAYFKFYLMGAADEGFTFAIADADQNPVSDPDMCGAGGEDLGYSGNNLVTPMVKPPKIALEIDTAQEGGFQNSDWGVYQDSCNCSVTQISGNTYQFTSQQRNASFSSKYDSIGNGQGGGRRRQQGTYYLSNVTVSGNSFTAQVYQDSARTVPFTGRLRSQTYTLSYADPYGAYSNARNDPDANHAALVYWGYNRVMTNPKVSHPDSDDNVHDFGFATQTKTNSDPWNPYRSNPSPSKTPGLATVRTLGTVTANAANPYYHYVRIEAKRLSDYDGTKRSYQIKVWVLNNNDTNINTTGELAAFQNTALDYGNITGNGFTTITNTGNAYTFTDNNANFSHDYTTLTVGGQTYYLTTTSVSPQGTSFNAKVYTDAARRTQYTGALATGGAYQLQFAPPAPTLSPNGYTPVVVYDVVAGQEALKRIRVGFTVGSSTQQQAGRRRQTGTQAQTIVISNFVLETIP